MTLPLEEWERGKELRYREKADDWCLLVLWTGQVKKDKKERNGWSTTYKDPQALKEAGKDEARRKE